MSSTVVPLSTRTHSTRSRGLPHSAASGRRVHGARHPRRCACACHRIRRRLRQPLAPLQRRLLSPPSPPRHRHRVHPPLHDRHHHHALILAHRLDLRRPPSRRPRPPRRRLVRHPSHHRSSPRSPPRQRRLCREQCLQHARPHAVHPLHQHDAPARSHHPHLVVAARPPPAIHRPRAPTPAWSPGPLSSQLSLWVAPAR